MAPPNLSVADARAAILANAEPSSVEHVPLWEADDRVLASALSATRTQPPFDVSAMDGFAVRAGDVTTLPVTLKLIGEAAAGHGFERDVGSGEAVRIFTGAPVPNGADAIVIQENTEFDARSVTVVDGSPEPGHIRPQGFDFTDGEQLITAPRRLNARDITLAAAMGHAQLPVRRRPRVALLATGDELVLPGEPTGPDQIVCSNPFGIASIVRRAGGEPVFFGIAKDDRAELSRRFNDAADCDVTVAIGGASVGDHDLVGPVLQDLGMSLDFWKIAMRPGKPLMYGRLGARHMLGLPGNPVSSMICARIFSVPLIQALLGLTATSDQTRSAIAGRAMTANGPREHYMRATLSTGADGNLVATPVRSQDSSLLSPLAEADALIVRSPRDPAKAEGDTIQIVPMDF
ncbi:MAG: molybdopterin molybdotransferase [Hyphomicrobiaceae bacterium]|jgi:molybdopterin molybdotransferase